MINPGMTPRALGPKILAKLRNAQTGGSTNNRFVTAMHGATERGDRAESEYLDRATSYDANEAVRSAAEGGYGAFRRGLDQDMAALRGQQVAMGRLDTGFGQGDEDRLVTESVNRFQDEILRNSMTAAGLNLRNIEGIGGFGNTVAERGASMLAGQRDYEMAQKNAKKKKRGGLLGALGMAGGFLLGGPAGAAIGGALGRGIGEY